MGLPLGRRIAEIMKEKGKAFSQQAIANKMGISRETVRLMLTGERVILPHELNQIASFLKVPVERIKQEDTYFEVKELSTLLDKLGDKHRALELAQRIANVAIGVTERCEALNHLGNAYYDLQKYEEAHASWLLAYHEATEIKERYKETEFLFNVTKNLMISFAARKEYTHLSNIISELEPIFDLQPEYSGALCYSYAMIEYEKGNIEATKQRLYQSLEYYIQTGDRINIGIAERNVGFIEFVTSNYEKSKEYFELALPKLEKYDYSYWVTVKDYSKTLIKLGILEHAKQQITTALEIAGTSGLLELEGKLMLLLGRIDHTPEHAKKVVSNCAYGSKVRDLGCKYLMEYYKRAGEAELFMKYHELSESIRGDSYMDLIEEEDL
ncbi:hypothetical protein EV586_103464 [Tumebacillus sp. BK434]|uniref:helix-turn-helix domain-containing protein n=1 Tax=Tumebacillus sp. BK434 TaxID=2512169 RepID=UPI001051A289|nr:helix-turn-helix transcriptional regulator [Tumebacillus sp. BK434]TCP55809.1 hypothetical protein EV586_103464 [Tumebacillus sp. BK434]